MSTASDKKQVIQNISVLRTLTSLPTPNNSLIRLDSFNSTKNKDPFIFLIEILITLVGVDVLLEIIGKLLSSNLSKFEKQIKKSLKKQIIGSTPQNSQQSSNLKNGFDVSLESIDIFNNQKVDPLSPQGNAVYGSSNSFERFLKKVLSNPGQQYGYPQTNQTILYTYDQNTNKLNVKSNNSLSYNKFIETIIDQMIIFDRVIIIAMVYDLLFGVISKETKKSGQQVGQIDKLLKIVDKLSENVEDDSFFNFNIDELTDIEIKSENKKDGIMQINACCSVLNTEFTLQNVNDVISRFQSTLSENESSNIIRDSANSITSPDENISSEDKASTKNNFFREFLNSLKKSIIYSLVLSPQMRILYSIGNTYQNGANNTDVITDIINNKTLLKCVMSSLNEQINQMLFDLLQKEVLKIGSEVASLYAKESADKSRIIAKSLLRLK